MNCDICARAGSDLASVGMHCASCARTILYTPRLEHGRILLEKASLATRLETITLAPTGTERESEAWHTEVCRTQANNVKAKIAQQQAAISSLHEQIRAVKDQISQKKADILSRRSRIRTIKATSAEQDKIQVDRVTDKMARGSKAFDSIHQASVETRTYLCREAANLLRLRQGKSRMNGQSQQIRYLIGPAVIPDLRLINNVRCTEVTAMLTSYTHLLSLVAFYLGVRLPAEITLPHRNYPLATINTPPTSYVSSKIDFPGSGSYLAMTELSKNSESRTATRPRPLFVGSDDKNELVSDLARKDPSAFRFFIEAVSLLAWNVAWLIHSQGLSTGNESWSDACDIGSSLWLLVYGAHQSPAVRRVLSRRDGKQRHDSSRSRSNTPPVDGPLGQLGAYSHASAHDSLSSATRMLQLRTMRLSKYNMIADPLRRALENEMKNAEWEMLHDDEILDGGENFDEAVVIPTRNMDGNHYDATRSLLATKNQLDQHMNGQPRGTSGWTKVKNREEATRSTREDDHSRQTLATSRDL